MTRSARADDVDVRSSDYLDVVETTDGSVWKGVVVEQTPGVQYKIVTSDGSIHVIKAADVVKLTKQRNPWRASGATASSRGDAGLDAHAQAASGLPAPFVSTGLRADAALDVVFPTGDIKGALTSFAPDLRIGYESLFGNFGVTGGAHVRFIDWLLPGDAGDVLWTLETHVYGHAALHLGRVAPYVGVSLGTDLNYAYAAQPGMSATGFGFGMNVQLGLPIAVTRAFALELGFDVHPATDHLIDGSPLSVAYYDLRLGGGIRF